MMKQDLLDFIRNLSEKDEKSLAEKALKTTEEVGELAKAVLPYGNAAGTRHRFVHRKQILDSSVDVILCALSMAYDLGFTDQEINDMMFEKSRKWSGLQVKEAKAQFPLPFEIHVTVDISKKRIDNPIDSFKIVCESINVKPIVLDLERDNEVVMIDVMTSSVHFGDNTSSQKEADRISSALYANGYDVIRVKIETVPWHPAAPSIENKTKMPENSYFESHLRVITTENRKKELQITATHYNAHLSRNYFKKLSNDQYIIMLTLREYKHNAESFKYLVEALKKELEDSSFVVDKAEIEFALYDTNTTHDQDWLYKHQEG